MLCGVMNGSNNILQNVFTKMKSDYEDYDYYTDFINKEIYFIREDYLYYIIYYIKFPKTILHNY